MKRILKTIISQDASVANPAQIEAFKALWRATFEPCGITPSFEVEEIDELAQVRAMLRLVHSEFCENDGTAGSDEQLEAVIDEP